MKLLEMATVSNSTAADSTQTRGIMLSGNGHCRTILVWQRTHLKTVVNEIRSLGDVRPDDCLF